MSQNYKPKNGAVVILAAGRGTRMQSELPKVAVELLGKPLLVHVMENLYAAGLRKFCVIVGYKRDVVKSIVPHFEDATITFAEQAEQKGTAHAFLCAADALKDFTGSVLVASGDMPALSANSFHNLMEHHSTSGCPMTVLSAELDDPAAYGRLVRAENGDLQRIVEFKDGDATIHKIKEVNTGTYVFEGPAVFSDLEKIGSDNAQKEYYLPDMIDLYTSQKKTVASLKLDKAGEAMGVNSTAELEILEELIRDAS